MKRTIPEDTASKPQSHQHKWRTKEQRGRSLMVDTYTMQKAHKMMKFPQKNKPKNKTKFLTTNKHRRTYGPGETEMWTQWRSRLLIKGSRMSEKGQTSDTSYAGMGTRIFSTKSSSWRESRSILVYDKGFRYRKRRMTRTAIAFKKSHHKKKNRRTATNILRKAMPEKLGLQVITESRNALHRKTKNYLVWENERVLTKCRKRK